jgi:hypothetical protein
MLSVSECAALTSHGPAAGSGDVTRSGGFARHNQLALGSEKILPGPLLLRSMAPKLLSIPKEPTILVMFIVPAQGART